MAKLHLHRGITSVILRVVLIDSTTGNGKTGLTSGSSGLKISTIADNEATATAYSGSNLETITTLGTYAAPTSGKARFKEVDATNHPGLYEIHLADARFGVSSSTALIVTVSGVTDVPDQNIEIDLQTVDLFFKRDLSAIAGEASRSLLNAIRILRNKFSISGATMTVYKEDDSTSAWTSTLTTDGAANPITASDPS